VGTRVHEPIGARGPVSAARSRAANKTDGRPGTRQLDALKRVRRRPQGTPRSRDYWPREHRDYRQARRVTEHAELPAMMIVGARGCGRSTTALRHSLGRLRLDRSATARAAGANPDELLLSRPEPVLVDEWQLVPDVLAAAKRAIDERPATTSTSHARRCCPAHASFVPTGRANCVPCQLCRQHGQRRRTFASSQRCARPRSKLQRIVDLAAVAANSAGNPPLERLCRACEIDRQTAQRYDALLERLFPTEQVASWSANHLSRVAKRSKRYVREPGLLGHLLGIDRRAALRNADAAGRLIDTFVVAQLRSELAYM
jgi:predicted AAA+ superfamily ATPase